MSLRAGKKRNKREAEEEESVAERNGGRERGSQVCLEIVEGLYIGGILYVEVEEVRAWIQEDLFYEGEQLGSESCGVSPAAVMKETTTSPLAHTDTT